MKLRRRATLQRAVALVCACGLALSVAAQETASEATIHFCDGGKTLVRNLRVAYSWREMPAGAEGLTEYQIKTRAIPGIWVSDPKSPRPGFQLVPFAKLEAIEFESEVKQLGVSETHEFRVQRIVLLRLDGTKAVLSKELLGDDHPVLWPQSLRFRFPEALGDKRMDRITVQLQGKTKLEGVESEYVFVMPKPVTTANQTVLKKQRDAFPKRIQFSHAGAVSKTATAK
jgi:hypothetical protein